MDSVVCRTIQIHTFHPNITIVHLWVLYASRYIFKHIVGVQFHFQDSILQKKRAPTDRYTHSLTLSHIFMGINVFKCDWDSTGYTRRNYNDVGLLKKGNKNEQTNGRFSIHSAIGRWNFNATFFFVIVVCHCFYLHPEFLFRRVSQIYKWNSCVCLRNMSFT